MWYKLSNLDKVMYILRGPSGSGKSTKAKELGISGTIFSTDDFWMKDGKYLWDISRLTEAHLWNQKRTEEALKQGVSPVIIDNTNIEPHSMKPYVQMALKYRYKVELVPVEVKNTAQELAERNKHGVPAESIQKMIDRYNPRVTMIDILKSKQPEIKKEAAKDNNYYSIGHDPRNYKNIILWLHDGNQLLSKESSNPRDTHLRSFGKNEYTYIAKGRVEKDKNVSSFVFIPKSETMQEINREYKKVIFDLKNKFPGILFLQNGKPLEENIFSSSNPHFANNTSKRIKESNTFGEYWIDEDGNALYADGDIGNMNHEMYVIQRAQGTIAPYEYSQNEYVEWDEFFKDIALEILQRAKTNKNEAMELEREIGESLNKITVNDIISYDIVENELIKRGIDKALLNVALGRGDARLYGMKEWGWKRIVNNRIQTYTLTSKDINSIINGLSQIAEEDETGTSLWNIESLSNDFYVQNIPLHIIEKGPTAILAFSRTVSSKGWFSKIIGKKNA